MNHDDKFGDFADREHSKRGVAQPSAGEPAPTSPPRHGDGEHARRVAREQGRPFGSLFRDFMRQARLLLTNEMRLARAETREMFDVVRRNLAAIAIGAGFGLGAMLALTMAFTGALVELFDEFMSENVYVWLAPLVVSIVFGIVAYALVRKGASAIQRQGFYPHKTAETLKEDTEWIRRRVS